MIETVIVSATALATAIGVLVKQLHDNRNLRRWLCTREPCDQRITLEPPPAP